MDRVLIWDGNQDQSDQRRARLEKLNQFRVETADTFQSVKEVLKKKPVSVLVVNLIEDYLEKLELIGFMTRHHWTTPCIVMLDSNVDCILQENEQQILQLIPKPVEFKTLVKAIISSLYLKDEGMAHTGMSLVNFLLLLQLAKQTCRLEIRAPGSMKGYFYFKAGELLDAQYKSLSGNEAVSELLRWEKIMVYFRDLPARRARKRFKRNLTEIITQQLSGDENSLNDCWEVL